MNYNSSKHQKFLIIYHIILVTRYRKKLSVKLRTKVKELIEECCKIHDFEIVAFEIDSEKPDHYHLMLNVKPDIAPIQISKWIKQYVSYNIWRTGDEEIEAELNKLYWKRHQFFSEGTFICTIGNASCDTIQYYIEKQG